MALGLHIDDGTGGFPSNCFPVRTLIRQGEEAAGAWLVAQRAEQRRRFKAVLCTKPKTFSQIREERKKSEKQNTNLTDPNHFDQSEYHKDAPILDGFFLLRHCCVNDPSDLCSVNLSGKELSDVKDDDFVMFDNVAYVNASENYLPFEAFAHFPIIRELEIPLNGLRGLKLQLGMFPHLEMLDLSYNNLSQEDILSLGLLQNLRVLHLSGNNFRALPPDMTMPHRDNHGWCTRYPNLEILMLDDNKFSDVNIFACLAGLRRLRHLNLEKNELYFVPQLKVMDGRVQTSDEKVGQKKRRSSDSSGRSGRRSRQVRLQEEAESLLRNTPRSPQVEDETPRETIQPETILENIPTKPSSSLEEIVELKLENNLGNNLLEEDFSAQDLSARISDLNLESEIEKLSSSTQTLNETGTSLTVYEEKPGPPPPPFSELRYLNLAHNQISSEEALLAVAAWPMLVELVINNNPLTIDHSGDPPLLKRFLGDRLGIHLVRKKSQAASKPHVEVPTKKSRKVSSIVPKVPKPSVEQRLMLESPQAVEALMARPQSNLEQHKILPPLTRTPDLRPASSGSKGKSRSKVKVEDVEPDNEAWGEKTRVETTDNPAFFMTQVEDKAEDSGKALVEDETSWKLATDERYRGYEILLDSDGELDVSPPKDISGNVRALKYALAHQLVYRDSAAQLDTVGKHVKPYRKTELTKQPAKSKEEKIDEALLNLKTRQTVEEERLSDVLTSRKKYHKKFPQAEQLLDEIQRRYNSVRVQSMKEAKAAGKVLQDTMNDIQHNSSMLGMNKVKRGSQKAV